MGKKCQLQMCLPKGKCEIATAREELSFFPSANISNEIDVSWVKNNCVGAERKTLSSGKAF